MTILGAATIACSGGDTTNWEYMPGMMDAASIKTYEGDPHMPDERSVRVPVEGTVPRGFVPFPKDIATAATVTNPLTRSMATLEFGQETYATYCYVCHGTTGAGDGPIIPKFPPPPPITTDRVHGLADGQIMHILAYGQNQMPSYASQMTQRQRWAVVHYVRVLHRAANPTEADLAMAGGEQ